MKISISSDHAGHQLRNILIDYLKFKEIENVDRSILICGSGNGVAMTANRYPNVRCAIVWNKELTELARKHNDANCISIPARFVSVDMAKLMVDSFLKTEFEGGRHGKRINKINMNDTDK